jgi:putative heme-binding domain-containing protein
LRMTLGPTSVEKVEVIEDTLLECRGLLYAYDSLYVNANNSKGFYRLRDTDDDDQFDEKRLLLPTEGGVGHGRNQITLGPDGMIYLAHGNDVMLTPRVAADSPMRNFADDQLLLGGRKGPGPGYFMPPAGHVLQTDRDGKTFRLIAGGFRNMLEVAFNAEGEMFTYDSDNERFIGAPWYVPTRVVHVVSGADYGWRRGTDVWPTYYPDSLPGTIEVGVGSPTGLEFGTRSHYPPKYRQSLFVADWAYGRILSVHLTPQGASYAGSVEPFVAGRPLNVTDLTFGPDGAMYFVTGGRGTMSGLYRVSYPGGTLAITEPAKTTAEERRALRRRLEGLHAGSNQSSISEQNGPASPATRLALLWPHLSDPDPWIRHAARVALETQPLASWQERALAETNWDAGLTALLAVARTAPSDVQTRLLARLGELRVGALDEARQLAVVRIYALSFIRQGRPDPAQSAASLRQLESMYPSTRRHVNHELCRVLVYLESSNVVAKTIPILAKATASEDLLFYLSCLRQVPGQWAPEQQEAFFMALGRAEQEQGSRDYLQDLKTIRKEVAARLSAADRASLGPLLQAKVAGPERAVDSGGLQFVKEWKLADFADLAAAAQRSLPSGRQAFSAAQCDRCHRFGVEPGGVIGPDLTSVAARFSRRDLLEAILSPSKVIDDKFRNLTVTLGNGETLSGAIEHEDADQLLLTTGSDEPIQVAQRDVVERKPSDVSPMPEGLLNVLTKEKILDLLAWLESGASANTSRPVTQP